MKAKAISLLAVVVLTATTTLAAQAEHRRSSCRHIENSSSPMTWSEDFGVSTCNDRASTPYRPWHSTEPIRKNLSDPMVARDDWRVNGFGAYDNRYDDRYDRRAHRYR